MFEEMNQRIDREIAFFLLKVRIRRVTTKKEDIVQKAKQAQQAKRGASV